LKECREEEDADKCEVTEWSDGMTLHRRLEAYVEADYEHYDALGYGGPEEGLSATERVGGEEEEGGAGYHFNTAVDSSSEETCICARYSKINKDGRRIVVNSVSPSHLLTDHKPN